MFKRIIKSILALLKEDKTKSLIKNGFIEIGKNTRIVNINVDIRHMTCKKTYLKIGDNSIISGNFVFETPESIIEIGSDTYIGGGSFISAKKISIGNDVMFSWGCTVIDTNAHSLNWDERKDDVKLWKKGIDSGQFAKYKEWSKVLSKPIVISDKCWIGFNSIILKGVKLGEECVVGAGSVVSKSFSESSIVGGNPAQIIKKNT